MKCFFSATGKNNTEQNSAYFSGQKEESVGLFFSKRNEWDNMINQTIAHTFPLTPSKPGGFFFCREQLHEAKTKKNKNKKTLLAIEEGQEMARKKQNHSTGRKILPSLQICLTSGFGHHSFVKNRQCLFKKKIGCCFCLFVL